MADSAAEARTVTVRYGDGETILVKAVPWLQTDDLWDLLKILVTEFADKGLYVGEFLRPKNKTIVSTLKKVCAMLPVVGGGEIELERLDANEVIDLFVVSMEGTTSNEVGQLIREDGGHLPGKVAHLHGFDFFEITQAAKRDRAKRNAPRRKVSTSSKAA